MSNESKRPGTCLVFFWVKCKEADSHLFVFIVQHYHYMKNWCKAVRWLAATNRWDGRDHDEVSIITRQLIHRQSRIIKVAMNYLYAVIIEPSEVMSTIANGSSKPSKEQTCAHMSSSAQAGDDCDAAISAAELSQISVVKIHSQHPLKLIKARSQLSPLS